MRRSTTRGRQGDFLRVCERSGFTVWASDTVRQWDGLIVRKDLAEERHPQDFLRARRDNMRVPDPRPEPTPVFVGPLYTEIVAPVAQNFRVAPMGALGEYALGQGEPAPMHLLAAPCNAAGSFIIAVATTIRMVTYDDIGVYVNNGDLHRTTIRAVVNPKVLLLHDRLPDGVSVGNKVVNYSAVAQSSLE
jgi:hypothetical protein